MKAYFIVTLVLLFTSIEPRDASRKLLDEFLSLLRYEVGDFSDESVETDQQVKTPFITSTTKSLLTDMQRNCSDLAKQCFTNCDLQWMACEDWAR